jgi:hypothetical protein
MTCCAGAGVIIQIPKEMDDRIDLIVKMMDYKDKEQFLLTVIRKAVDSHGLLVKLCGDGTEN